MSSFLRTSEPGFLGTCVNCERCQNFMDERARNRAPNCKLEIIFDAIQSMSAQQLDKVILQLQFFEKVPTCITHDMPYQFIHKVEVKQGVSSQYIKKGSCIECLSSKEFNQVKPITEESLQALMVEQNKEISSNEQEQKSLRKKLKDCIEMLENDHPLNKPLTNSFNSSNNFSVSSTLHTELNADQQSVALYLEQKKYTRFFRLIQDAKIHQELHRLTKRPDLKILRTGGSALPERFDTTLRKIREQYWPQLEY